MPKAPVQKTDIDTPAGAKVGRPHVPETYGLKASNEYLPWSFATERLTASKNYWICSARPDGRPHFDPCMGILAGWRHVLWDRGRIEEGEKSRTKFGCIGAS